MKKVLMFILLLSSFMCKVKAQVKYQTGSAEFGLPIFQWEDDRSRLSSSVSLSYSSGTGLQVANIPSNVGQGWHLQIGGNINRMQAGEPDDQKPRDGNYDDITKYPAGYLYDPVSAAEGCPKNLTEYPLFSARNKIYKPNNVTNADKELDKFSFEINGRSGVFCVGKNNGDKGILLGDSKLKIWFTRNENMPNIRTTINAFFIQDENGIIYKFTKLELTKVLKVKYSDPSGTYSQAEPKLEAENVYHESSFDDGTLVNPYVVNGWMLTEMEDAITHRKILFNYTPARNIDVLAGINLQANTDNGVGIITRSRSVTQSCDLASVVYPDGHTVTVNYGAERLDFAGQYAVKSLDVQYGARYISKYELNTQYFIGNRIGKPVTDFQKSLARLCLTSIKKIGVDLLSDDLPYMFEYYTGSSAPDDVVPAPFTYRKDIWGFYNGDNSRGYHSQLIGLNKPVNDLDKDEVFGLCFIRIPGVSTVMNPKAGYAKNGLLKKIIYPTGGSLKYEYEQNTGVLNGQNISVGGVHVSKSISSDDGNNYNCDVTNLTTNYKYISATNATVSSMWGIETPNNMYATSSYYAPMDKRYKWGVRHCGPLGCCKYKYQYPGILSREQAINLTWNQQFWEDLGAVLDVISIVTTVIDIIAIATGSTGIGLIISVGIEYWAAMYTLISTCHKVIKKNIYTTVYYNYNINNNPLPMQYSRVEVSENNGGNGRTVMEFTSPQDYAIWEPTNPALSNKQRFAYWAYGLPKKTTVFDIANKVVKESENVYDYQYAKSTNTEVFTANGVGAPQTVALNAPSCKCLVKASKSNRSDWWMDPANTDNAPANYTKNMTSNPALLADIYSMYTGRVELRKTIERVAATTSAQLIESTTEYAYNKNFVPNLVTTKQSNGDINKKFTVYTSDTWTYGAGQGGVADPLPRLVAFNVLNLPIATRQTVTKSSDNITYDLGETITEYNKTPLIDIKPFYILTKRYEQPTPIVPGGTNYYKGPVSYNASNPSPYATVKSFEYNEVENLASVLGEFKNTRQSYLYDYNDKYITATIINAGSTYGYTSNNVSHTSFETNKLNGWTINGANATSIVTAGVTGNNALQLITYTSLTSSLTVFGSGTNVSNNTQDGTKLSFWATNPVNILTGQTATTVTLLSSGPIINGFTYYEYKIENATQTGDYVNIYGTSIIDEVRLYRSDARMRTSTYDPLIGKTSECDENNRITYYEYDEKGRLRFIKDEKKNVVKMYEYNNAVKKTIPCPGAPATVYTNLETSEVFQRNDCRGYPYEIGSYVTYTVLAGTYTSSISQEVVDLQVQQNLQTNGQAYANTNGICTPLYGNAAQSATFTKEDCEVGFKGTTITYTVPANRYYETTLAAANAKALADVNANGQAYANTPGNASCVIDTEPDWEGVTPEVTQCGNGVDAAANHIMYRVKDINPNSPSYNTTRWSDGGESAACGGTSPTYIDITYTNVNNMQATIKLKNLSTNVVYTFTLAPSTTVPDVAGFVPAGNYEVKVLTLPHGSIAHTISVYNTTQTDTFFQSPVTITTSAAPIVRITL
jgi:Family of unknown function (DUF5977)